MPCPLWSIAAAPDSWGLCESVRPRLRLPPVTSRTGGTQPPYDLEHALRLGVPVLRHRLQRLDRLRERHHHDVGPPQSRHVTELLPVHGLHRMPSEARGEDAVVRGRRTTPLHVPQDHWPGFLPQPLLQLDRQLTGDPGEALMPVDVLGALVEGHGTGRRLGPLRDDDDREPLPRLEPLPDPASQFLDVEGPLRHDDGVRTGRHPGVQRYPAGVPPHDLDDEHPLVGLGGGLEPVEGLRRDPYRGVEPEGDVRDRDVVVDGLGHTHDGQTGVRHQPGGLERALTADGDDRVEPELLDMPPGPLHAVPQMRGLDPGGAEDRAAAGQDAAHRVEIELEVVALQEALPAVPETDDLVAVVGDGTVHDGPDDGVQAGAVAAGREDTNAHSRKTPLTESTWAGSGPRRPAR